MGRQWSHLQIFLVEQEAEQAVCLAVPGKLTRVDGLVATVDVMGTEVLARLDLVDDVAVGDYVLVHAGFAITRMEPQEAEETLALLRDIRARASEGNPVGGKAHLP